MCARYADAGSGHPAPMTTPSEPTAAHDPEAAEEFAESAGVDPTPEQVEHYQELVGDEPPQ